MLQYLRHIFAKKEHKHINRNFDTKLFKQLEYQKKLEKFGFVHLKNVVDNNTIEELIAIYNSAMAKYDFHKNKSDFLNTMALAESEPKNFIKLSTSPILFNLLQQLIEIDNWKMPFGGAYCINPPQTQQTCNPHQDPAYVDETQTYSIIVWIPLTDTNMDNGCLHVLPKSHFWDNNKRSVSMDWAFEEYSSEIWDHLIPIPAKFGDVIVFDGSLIHGTNANKTQKNRLAINIPMLPINQQMITFFPEGKNKGYCYEIDEDYYLGEFLYNKPSDKYPKFHYVELNNIYKYSDLIKLFNLSNKLNSEYDY